MLIATPVALPAPVVESAATGKGPIPTICRLRATGGHRLAQALTKDPLDVKFRCHWDGLAGRALASWRRHLSAPVDRCRQNSVTVELQCRTDEIFDALPELVGRLTKPLFQAFDFYTPTPQFVQREIAELRKSRT